MFTHRRSALRSACPVALAASFALCLPPFAPAAPARDTARPPAAAPAVAPSIAFEANLGQAGPRARFLTRSGSGAAFLAPDALGVVARDRTGRRGVALRLRFDGASAGASVAGDGPLAGRVNYLRGSDPSRWVTGVPTFASVRCRDVYPGIDVVYYANGADLEYDFSVAPGADPSAIRIAVEGARATRVDAATGDLVVETDLGELRQLAPVLYQPTASGRRPVAGRYTMRGATVGIEAGAYDRGAALVVDPVLRYSTYVGGSQAEVFNAVAVDAGGNAVTVGNSFSGDYPLTPGPFQMNQADDDVVVTKLSAAGNALVYSTYIGGDGGDFCSGVALDGSGNAYLTGSTFSTDFPTVNQIQSNQPNGDAFVTKLNATGTGLLYSTYLGGAADDVGRAIAIDATGAAFVTGGSESSNYPTTPSAFQGSRLVNAVTTFVTRVNTIASGPSSLVYSTYLGDTGEGNAIATDGQGRVYVAGHADGALFPVTTGVLQPTDQPAEDGFVAKLDTGLSGAASLVYSTYLGGNMNDACNAIAVDAAGQAHVAGFTLSGNFPTTAGGFQPSPPSASNFDIDAFYVKLNAGATALLYGSYLGGTDDEQAFGIALDSTGEAYLAGETFSTNFPTTPDPITGDQPDRDAFAARFDASRSGASSLVSSTYLGGNGFESAYGIAANNSGEAYVVGLTASTDYPTLNFFQQDQGLIDAFVTKLSLDAGATGSDTVGIYVAATGSFFLRNSNSPGGADIVFTFGAGGTVVPLVGDWNGDGTTTVGVYDPGSGAFFLRNMNSPGGADVLFTFGAGGAGLVPLVGDWNGDGTDTIGVYSPATGTFFLRNANSSGGADLAFTFGGGGALVPIVGDWNGDGVDTPGLYDSGSGAFFLRNANAPGGADIVFTFGAGGATPVTGDFDDDGTDTVGIYITGSGTWFLRNTNASGPADLAFSFGPGGATPLVGDWNGL